MASGDIEFSYKMDNLSRGYALLINNTRFDSRTQMPERNGSDKDAIRLHEMFEKYSFDVKIFHNQTTTQILKRFKDVSQTDHSECDMFVCAILSHGDEGLIYGTDGIIYLDTITEYIKGNNCLSLAGKPKVFFIQACRGHKLDHGVEVSDALGDGDAVEVRRIPSEADFLMCYSTVPGYFSWRNSNEGSYFIRALCRVLDNKSYEGEEIMKIMTRVNNIVAFEFESNTTKAEMHQKKQVPSIVSMLTKQLFLRPK